MTERVYDPEARAREKQAARDQDAADEASGRKTAEQLHDENAHFSKVRLRVDITSTRKPSSIFDDTTCYPGKVLDQPYAGAVRLAAEGYRAKRIETRRTRILRVPRGRTRPMSAFSMPYAGRASRRRTSTGPAGTAALPWRWRALWGAAC